MNSKNEQIGQFIRSGLGLVNGYLEETFSSLYKVAIEKGVTEFGWKGETEPFEEDYDDGEQFNRDSEECEKWKLFFVLGQDYIRTAKAKGVSGMKIIFGHALKNSLIPVITYFGPMLAYIVTGSLVVEKIFSVPGIGRAFVNSITGRDYPLIMGTTIVLAALIVIMNLLGDIMYKIVDPRISFE